MVGKNMRQMVVDENSNLLTCKSTIYAVVYTDAKTAKQNILNNCNNFSKIIYCFNQKEEAEIYCNILYKKTSHDNMWVKNWYICPHTAEYHCENCPFGEWNARGDLFCANAEKMKANESFKNGFYTIVKIPLMHFD